MLAVKFYGGLGNQLFQYAAARALKKSSDILLLDCNGYSQDYLGRKFGLSQFNIKGYRLDNKYIQKPFTPGTKFNRLISGLGLFRLLKEKGFYFHKDLQQQTRLFTLLDGYWQSENYFKKIRSQLLKELTPKKLPDIPLFLKHSDTVAVHVRRTDYLADQRYGFLGEVYYQNALTYFRKKLKNPLFVFFSDDPDWCKENFIDQDCIFPDDPDWEADYLQLFLIAQCKHQVIANSSFSWWGAWLNQYKHKKVIRPYRPFKDETLYYEHYYPPEWIAL